MRISTRTRVKQWLCGKFLHHDHHYIEQGTHITEDQCEICGHITYSSDRPHMRFHFADSAKVLNFMASEDSTKRSQPVRIGKLLGELGIPLSLPVVPTTPPTTSTTNWKKGN